MICQQVPEPQLHQWQLCILSITESFLPDNEKSLANCPDVGVYAYTNLWQQPLLSGISYGTAAAEKFEATQLCKRNTSTFCMMYCHHSTTVAASHPVDMTAFMNGYLEGKTRPRSLEMLTPETQALVAAVIPPSPLLQSVRLPARVGDAV